MKINAPYLAAPMPEEALQVILENWTRSPEKLAECLNRAETRLSSQFDAHAFEYVKTRALGKVNGRGAARQVQRHAGHWMVTR